MAALVAQWQKPIDALSKAGRAFDVSAPPAAPCMPCRAAQLRGPVRLAPAASSGPGAAAQLVLGTLCRVAALLSLCQTKCFLCAVLQLSAQGLESLLGGARGGSFDLGGNIWDRKVGGWGSGRCSLPQHEQKNVAPRARCIPCMPGEQLEARTWARGMRAYPSATSSCMCHSILSWPQGWAAMDKMREKLEDLKELRDLVRSLGR